MRWKRRQKERFSLIWWRWRESNPRPKMAPLGVYKLRLAFWVRHESSHERDGSNLASEGFDVTGGSGRSRYTR